MRLIAVIGDFMKITEKQFIKIVKRAFVYGIACSAFFEDHLNEEEQKKKILEIIEDCRPPTSKRIKNGSQ